MSSDWVETNLPCPRCGSSDAVSLNAAGWYTCFSGNHQEAHGSKSWPKDGSPPAGGQTVTSSKQGHTDCPTDVGGHYRKWEARGLTEETCRRFDVEWCPQKKLWVRWLRDDSGQRCGYQARGADKSFFNRGNVTTRFFGQHAARGGGKRLTITEGPEDAMAFSQAMSHKESVVSIPSGTGSVDTVFKAQCNWLATFDEVRLCFDSDEAGQEATKKALNHLNRIKPGCAYIISLPYKDANETLLKGGADRLVKAFWAAQKWQPPGFIDMATIMDASLVPPVVGIPYPWQGLTDITFGRRPGELVCWVAASGIGKTSVLASITAKGVQDGHTIGCIYLEQPPTEMTQRILGCLYGRALHDPSVETTDEQREEAKQVYREAGGRVVFFDASQADSGNNTWEVVRAAIQHLAIAEGCTSVILDNFTVLLSHKDGTDTELHHICKELKADAQRLGICVDAVSHVRKEGKSAERYEDGAFPKVSEIYGSGAIDRYCSFLFMLARNKMSDDPEQKNVTHIRCAKDRFTGRHEGCVVSLRYNPETSRLTEVTDVGIPCGDTEDADEELYI